MLAPPDSPLLACVPLSGVEVVLDPCGALVWPEEKLLVVADLHLEKGSAFARRGQMLPPYDTLETLGVLAAAVARWAPRTVIALGDSLHDRFAAERLTAPALARLKDIQRGRTFVWIAGNHDPERTSLEGEFAEALTLGPLLFRHVPGEHLPGDAQAGEVSGHLHPVARVVQRGRAIRRRCFATDGRRMVLPALGAFTGGLHVTEAPIRALFPRTGFSAHLLGAGRTYHFPVS